MTQSIARYSAGLRRLHWLSAVLILLTYVFIEQRGWFARGSAARALMVQAHFWTGLAIFALALWRLGLRVRGTVPPITPALSTWEAWPAKLVHLALYAFLVAMPLLGLATAWADDKAVLVPFTGIALPALLAADESLAQQLEALHGDIGEIFYWVIGAHVLASLYHHFMRRDDTLRRML